MFSGSEFAGGIWRLRNRIWLRSQVPEIGSSGMLKAKRLFAQRSLSWEKDKNLSFLCLAASRCFALWRSSDISRCARKLQSFARQAEPELKKLRSCVKAVKGNSFLLVTCQVEGVKLENDYFTNKSPEELRREADCGTMFSANFFGLGKSRF